MKPYYLPHLTLAFSLLVQTTLYGASIDPQVRNFVKEGGGAAIILTAGPAENWTATADVPWLNSLTPPSGTGPATVAYLVSANLSADTRVGKITLAGQQHVVTQTGYPSSVNPPSASFNLSGGVGQITVTVAAGISWTAASDSAWVRVVSGATGFGSGTVSFEVEAYQDVPTRFANIRVAGATFVVTQTGRDVVIKPANALAPPETSVIRVDVKALASTSWTVVSDVNWLFPIGTSSGAGDATIQVGVAENASWAQRFGSLRVGTAVLTVGQAGKANPVYAINPPSATAPAPGAAGVVAVSATLDAPWAATSSVPWLSIVAGGQGAGIGAIQYVVSQNPYITSRTGSIEFAGAPPQPAPDLMRALLYHFPFAGNPGSYANSASIDARDDGQDKRLWSSACPSNSVNGSYYFDNTYTRYNDLYPSRRSKAEMTCSFWFNADYANRVNRLLSLEGDTAGDTLKIYTEADGRLRVDGPRGSLYPNFWIEASRWYYLTVRQQTGAVDLWVNGRQIASQPWPDQVRSGLYRTRLGGGGSRWGLGNFYQGYIDELRLWDRDLSDNEMLSLYQNETEGVSARLYNAQPSNPALARPDARVAFYRMEGNNLDADQFGRAFEFVSDNLARFTTDRFGVANSAFRAEGSGYVHVYREVLFHTNQAASHVFWVRFGTLSSQSVFLKEWRDPNGREIYNDFGHSAPYYDRFCLRVKDTSNLQLIVRRDRNGISTRDLYSYNVEKTLETQKWYQVCITGDDASGTVKLFMDGVLLSSVSMPGFQWGKSAVREDNFSASYLGADYEVSRASGAFDDYQIYDRVLTAQEVYQLYQSERPKTYSHVVTQAGAVGVLSTNEVSYTAAGGAGSVALSIGSAAVWTVSSDSAWLAISGSTNGSGSGTINFTVSGNSTINQRVGILTIAGLSLRVVQAGRAVTVTGGGPFSFGPDGGSQNFSVSSENNSAWQVVNTNSWITVVSGASGTAPGATFFVVSPYGSPLVARSGFLTVGDKVITISQSGYTATVDPMVAALPANGGSRSVTVSVPAGAIWSALAQVPWITVIGGQSQSGSGALSYVVNGNAGGIRSGQIIVAGQVITINQAAATADALVNLKVGDASVRTGREVLVPITATGFTNIQSAQFTVKWDYGALEYISAENFGLAAMGAFNFGMPAAGTLTMSWEHPTLDQTTLSPTQPLFSLRFRVKGAPGSTSQVRVESIPTLLEIVDSGGAAKVASVQRGTVSVVSAFELSGRALYGETAIPVTNVAFALSGDLSRNTNSGTGSDFLFEVEDSVNVNVTASKADDTTASRGISTADVVLLRQHILGLSPFNSPYRLLAADANGSGTVTTADITQIRRLILAQITSLPGGMWRFMPRDYIFADPSVPFNAPNLKQFFSVRGDYALQDFIAIKLGDLNDSWTNSSGGVAPASYSRSASGPTVRVSQGAAKPGETGTVRVSLDQWRDRLLGLQFTLRWDAALFDFAGISTIGLPEFSAENFSVGQGRLAISWDNPSGQALTDHAGQLFDLILRAKGASGISEVWVDDQPTPRELVAAGQVLVPGAANGAILASTVLPVVKVIPDPDNQYIEFTIDPNLSYSLQQSFDLVHWQEAPNPIIGADLPNTLRYAIPGSKADSKKTFYRLGITSTTKATTSSR